ncbi:unnamed protein product [Phyllotreta striolata]|uniref:Uncharacterized protein n=1 Tax=Phyllotreta striolata TaxID=444603 RepID=A0A9N9XX32_PHYSR|nr:unnamed protein product [Phyllotreta striolata]
MKASSSVEDLKKSVNIRALISAYENISSEHQIKRPRANSLGNALNNDVVVRETTIRTLDDAYRVLDVVERRLQQYEIYNKEKHVAIQEELFNTLTSIINIDNDDPEEAKALIQRTKDYVSFLNTKLPSNKNGSSVYADRLATTNSSKPVQDDEIDAAKSGSTVRRLKERFQVAETQTKQRFPPPKKAPLPNKNQIAVEVVTTQNDTINLNQRNTFTSRFPPLNKAPLPNNNKLDEDVTTQNLRPETFKQPDNNEERYSVSVLKLKSIFESKSKENAEGLPLILTQPLSRSVYELNVMEARSDQAQQMEVSSYLETKAVEVENLQEVSVEANRLLGILKKEWGSMEFNYVSYDDSKNDANGYGGGDDVKKLEYLDENGNEDEGERYVEEVLEDIEENVDEESYSSSAITENDQVDNTEMVMSNQ